MITVKLNGFVRRTQNTDQLKAGIKATGATLNRKGRSRNWTLSATHEQFRQIIQFLNESEQDSWLWLIKYLKDNKPPLTYEELLAIATQNPGITLNQLVSLTDCTLIQARKALDAAEWG